MLETISVEKVDKENDAICLASMVLKLSKRVWFLQFCAGKKPKPVKTIYRYASKTYYALSVTDMV